MLLYRWLSEVARSNGNGKALMYRDTYLSWRGLQHRVDRRANELASMGLGKGQWIGLMLGNVPDFAILTLALSRLGATVVPLDPTLGARDLGLLLELAPLKALITRPRGGIDTQVLMPSGRARPSEPLEARRRLQGTLLTCSIYKHREADVPPDAQAVLFTTDSLGDPKGVIRTSKNLEAGVEQLRTTLEVSSEDRILTTVPLHQAYGFDLGLVMSLRFGAVLHIEDDLAPKRIAKILRDHEIDLLPASPTLYAGLAKMPTARPLRARRARFLSSGMALDETTAESFRAAWGVRLLPMYHTTEAHAIAIDRKGSNPDSVGKAVDGVEIRLGEGGGIWVRSPAVANHAVGARPAEPRLEGDHKGNGKGNGRNGKGEKVRATVGIGCRDGEGWYRTGDLGRIDRAGRLYLTGREDDLVKVDGRRVALGEVDACLESFPKVKAAQARVVSDPLAGPVVVASVVVAMRCIPEEIIDHCARNLAPYKVPRRIEFCEHLP